MKSDFNPAQKQLDMLVDRTRSAFTRPPQEVVSSALNSKAYRFIVTLEDLGLKTERMNFPMVHELVARAIGESVCERGLKYFVSAEGEAMAVDIRPECMYLVTPYLNTQVLTWNQPQPTITPSFSVMPAATQDQHNADVMDIDDDALFDGDEPMDEMPNSRIRMI